MTKQDVQACRALEKWRLEEPRCRGYEARYSSSSGGRLWALTYWSMKDDAVSRWGIITGYGSTLTEAYNDAIAKRTERLPLRLGPNE
jgi:hypothetical protein